MTAVAPLVEDGAVDGAPILPTKIFGANQVRGLCLIPSDVYIKRWDDSIFLSRRYESGNNLVTLEQFWNVGFGHPSSHYRFRQD